MLAGYVEHLSLGPHQNLIESVELSSFRAVRQVAGMNEEIGGNLIGADFVQCGLQGCRDVGIHGLVEADMTVADLHKVEVCQALTVFRTAEGTRYGNASDEAPDQSSTGPGHALQKATTINSIGADHFLFCSHNPVRRIIPLPIVVGHNCSPRFTSALADVLMQTAPRALLFQFR